MEQLPQKQTQQTNGLIRSAISGQLQIRHLKNETPIRQALLVCFKLVGLREKHWPKDREDYPEKTFLINYVKEHYPDLVAKELILAFKMLTQRKLDLPEDKIEVYDNFSPEYLGRVLSSYRRLRQKELSKSPKSVLHTVKSTKIDKKEYYETKLFKPYQELLKGKYTFTDIDEKYLYRSLDKLGIVMATNEEKRDIFADVKARNPRKYREEEKSYIKRLQEKSKEIAFRQWIQGKALNEEDIETEIKERL